MKRDKQGHIYTCITAKHKFGIIVNSEHRGTVLATIARLSIRCR